MNTPENTPQKRRTCCLVLALCAAIPLLTIVLSVGGFLFLRMSAPALIISEETTRITGPLTAEGHIDFFKALEEKIYPPELATDDNGFRSFVRTFGDVTDIAEQHREFYRLQKYEKLGLDPDILPTLTLPLVPRIVIENFYAAKREEVPAGKVEILQDPWTLEQLPMLEKWINEIDVPLDAIAEAIQKPVFFVPLVQSQGSVESGRPELLMALLIPDIQLTRDIARMFQVRATFRIAQGNIDGAIDDKLTLHRLGRLISPSGTMISYLVGISIEGMAWGIPVGANPDHPLAEEQLRHILAGLDALPPRIPLNDVLEWERYVALDAVQLVARDNISLSDLSLLSEAGIPAWYGLATYLPCNWNIVYRRMNEVFDAMQEPSPRRKYHLLMESASSAPTLRKLIGLLTPNGRGEIVADNLIEMLVPAFDAFEAAIHRAECLGHMQRLALAILLYQLEHGTMPGADWATQIAPHLGDNPERYFSCPKNPAAEGKTTYALVLYGDEFSTDADTLLLIELAEAVPFAEAVITVDEILEHQRWGSLHSGRVIVAHRSGAVRSMPPTIEKEELLRMLGREKFDPQMDAD